MYRFLLIATLFTTPLLAERVGPVEFQFPSAHYEWKELINTDNLPKDEDYDLDAEGEEVLDVSIKTYTHREGDALELFIASSFILNSGAPSVGAPLTDYFPESNDLFEFIGALKELTPSHQLALVHAQETSDGYFIIWECNDGETDLLHGYIRTIKTKDGVAILQYITTALATEQNLLLWTKVLADAKIVD